MYSFTMTIYTFLIRKSKENVGNVVSCTLGDYESEKGKNGLEYVPYLDGNAVREFFDNQYVRRTDYKNRHGYIYFTFTENIVGR